MQLYHIACPFLAVDSDDVTTQDMWDTSSAIIDPGETSPVRIVFDT